MVNWVGSFHIKDSVIQENNNYILDHSEASDQLFDRIIIFSQPNNLDSDSFCREIMESVLRDFIDSNFSITGRVLKALNNANMQVVKWNQNSLQEHKVQISLTCLIISNNQILIANSGSNFIASIEKTKIKKPNISKVDYSDPLGSQNKFQPLFKKINFASNDLIVASEQLNSELSTTEMNMILKGGVERSLSDLFNRTRNLKYLSVCYFSQVEDNPKIPEGAFYLEQQSVQLELDVDKDNFSQAAIPSNKDPETLKQINDSINKFNWSSNFFKLSQYHFSIFPDFKLKINKFNLFGLLALFFGLGIFGLIFFNAIFYSEIKDERINNINNNIEKLIIQYDELGQNKDKAAQRQILNEALLLIEEGSVFEFNDLFELLKLDIQKREKLFNNIFLVSNSDKLLIFENNFANSFFPNKLVSNSYLIWILDSGSGRIFQYTISDNSFIEIFRQNNFINDILLGEPITMSYDQFGKKLFILDSNNNLFVKKLNNQLDVYSLDSFSSNVKFVDDMEIYNDDLYIYDSNLNEILLSKFQNTAQNEYFKFTNLIKLEEKILGIDFNKKLLLFTSGNIWQYNDSLIEFSCLGIDEFPSKISDVIFGESYEQIFIADNERNRIIECNNGKDFKGQWVNKDFIDIKSLFYDSNNQNLYALTSSSIFEIEISE
ncbi:MAG: hypothetical protein CL779_00865 [Chloroflexi bacterium]|nr:hypothetical protein [Chloroflexota bacterium]|tara:strand:- start:1240 stop:3225 length:1986 start_codon:yes stop_codon:yes gene_type:complete